MINEDIRHIVERELREGEVLLWAQPRKALKDTNEHFSTFLGWAIVAAFGIAFITGVYLSVRDANLPITFVWVGCFLTLIWLFTENYTFRETKPFYGLVYAITDKRILAFNNKGENHTIVGRPFFSCQKYSTDSYNTISLIGPGADDDMFEFHFEHIEQADAAQKIILENFMQAKD